MRFIRAFLANEYTWFAIYLVIVLSATTICVERRRNNFLIFRAAFDHLIAGRDLYVPYPREHADLFKYSPTFALLFAPFARLPYNAALLGWNLLNVMLVFQAIRLALPREQRLVALQLTGIGLVTTVDGTQSNALVAALIVLAFVALERGWLARAALAIGLGASIKIFPLAAGALAFTRRDRARFVLTALGAGALLIALPLVVIGSGTLVAEYRSWYSMGATDALDRGASIMRLLHLVAGYEGPNWPIQLAGTLLVLLPLVKASRWKDPEFRKLFLASLLVYCVIFNHKAEQPTFVIAVVGVAIWYAVSAPSSVRHVVAGSVFVATVPILVAVAAPESFPGGVSAPLLLTSACCTVAWFTMQGELLDLFPERGTATDTEFASVSDEAAA